MFREYLHRTYQALTRGRNRRAPKITRTRRPAATRLAVEALEDRTLLSLTLTGDGTLALCSDPANPATAQVLLNGTVWGSQPWSTVGSVTLTTGNGNDTVNIENVVVPATVTVNLGCGADVVNISPTAQDLNTIQGNVTILSGAGVDTLTVNDQSNASGQIFNMAAGSVSRTGSATINYGTGIDFVNINAGNGTSTFNVSGTEPIFATTLNTGNGSDLVKVDGTGSGGTFTINLGTGVDGVILGASVPDLGNLHGTITVNGSPGGIGILQVNDQANTGNQTFTLASHSITRTGSATINYNDLLNNLQVSTGTGADTVNIQGTSVPVFFTGDGPDTVNVGNAGSLQQIARGLTLTNPPDLNTINIDDSADSLVRTATLITGTSGGGNLGFILGLSGGPIVYKYADTSAVTLQLGTNTPTVIVQGTGVPVNLISRIPTIVDVVTDGSVQQILGALTLTNPPSFDTIFIDDSRDSFGRTATLDTVTSGGVNFGRVRGLSAGAILYQYANTASVTLQLGTNTPTANVLATGVPVNLISRIPTTVNVGNAGRVQQIASTLTLTNPTSFDTINVNDSADSSPTTATLDTVSVGGSNFGIISGLAPGTIQYRYADTTGVNINTGTGGATVNARTTGKPVNLFGTPSAVNTLSASDGANTWNVTGHNAGNLGSSLLAGPVTFSGVRNLTGGNGGNTFVFANGAGVDGSIDGGGGSNTLNYASYSSSVLVDLRTGIATGVGSVISHIQNVIGGSGGGAGIYNILVGNGGNVLTGGDGRRNLLIAGTSASTLLGGNDDDILIGGTTAYDTEAGLVSLQAIMAYWSGTSDDYATRVNKLLTGNGVPLLDATRVHNNGGGNTLTGHHGGAAELNLFYGLNTALETTDFNPGIGERFINC
jgi:hypothetical protein